MQTREGGAINHIIAEVLTALYPYKSGHNQQHPVNDLNKHSEFYQLEMIAYIKVHEI